MSEKRKTSNSESNVENQKKNSINSVQVESKILEIRNEKVILDSDLAKLYNIETKRLNEQVKRNSKRFGDKYVFQLSQDEYNSLKSQIASSKTGKGSGRGGRRTMPWAFTEHGVVMTATILDSDKAIEASKLIVDVFVEVKRRIDQNVSKSLVSVNSDQIETPLLRLQYLGKDFSIRLQKALNSVLDSVIDSKSQSTVREEAQNLISESIQHLKERLKKPGLENEELAAKVTKLLAEAEKEKAIAAKTRAESEKIQFAIIVKKLRLLIEAQKAIEHGQLEDFLTVLKELSDDN